MWGYWGSLHQKDHYYRLAQDFAPFIDKNTINSPNSMGHVPEKITVHSLSIRSQIANTTDTRKFPVENLGVVDLSFHSNFHLIYGIYSNYSLKIALENLRIIHSPVIILIIYSRIINWIQLL